MFRFHFAARLTLYSVALIVLSVMVSSVTVYHFKIRELTDNLGKELLGIVNTTAVAIDAGQHERIQFDAAGKMQDLAAFNAIQQQLIAIKRANNLTSHGSPIYTVRATEGFATNRVVEFVVLTDPDETGQIPAGNLYEAPQTLQTALAGQSATSGVYTDPHGEWISAAAPIRDKQGRVVGAVQADRTAAYFAKEALQTVKTVLVSALASVAGASFLAWWFARRLVKPLKQLAETARQVGRGNFDFKAELNRGDEIGDISRSFDDASRQLADSRKRDQALTSDLQTANQQLERAVASATELAVAAQAADRAKSEFLAAMSHELRTPLNHVIGLGEFVLDSPLDADQRENVELMRNSGQELLRMVEGVLDFSMMESRRLRLSGAPFDLRACVDAAAADALPKAAGKPIQFTIEVADGVPAEMFGDAARLRQVLFNLLENSMKFTERGTVSLRVTSAGEMPDRRPLRFSVQDTGPGIGPDQRTQLFKSFTQLDGSNTRRHGGIGLGLVLSQRLVQLMGSEITVQSEVGQGSTFSFVLDSAPPPATEPAA